jgi:hypothetical protein
LLSHCGQEFQTHTQKHRSQNINLPRRPRFATKYTRSQPRRNTNPTTTIANITTQSTTQQLENDYNNNQQQIQTQPPIRQNQTTWSPNQTYQQNNWIARQPIRDRPQDQEPRPNIARCVYCEQIGHYIHTCFTLKAYREGRRPIIQGKCKICLRQFNTKCREGTCHIVVNTRGLTPKNEDLRCQQHKEINYLSCYNERCRQLLERKKQENTQRNYNNPQRYQTNTRENPNNPQRRQNNNRRPERPQVTFANILHVTQPKGIPTEVINNTRIHSRKHTFNKNIHQNTNTDWKQTANPLLAIEKISIRNNRGEKQELIVMYDTAATDGLLILVSLLCCFLSIFSQLLGVGLLFVSNWCLCFDVCFC